MLYMIGLGLQDGDVPRRGMEALAEVDTVFAETYTNSVDYDLEALGEEVGKEVRVLERGQVEEEDLVLEAAEEEDVAFLVSGDPLAATTHQDILFRARERGMEVEVVHAPSVFTAVAETGFSLYKFGRTTTLTEQSGEVPDSVFEAVEENQGLGLHTLLLLDIGMTVADAAELLEGRVNGEVVACTRLGMPEQEVEVRGVEELGEAPQAIPAALVVPGELSVNERERLQSVK